MATASKAKKRTVRLASQGRKEARKLTIKHGPIPSIDMPPMTMVFQVKDPAMLDQEKAGDKVKFTAEEKSGAYVVTAIEAAK